MRRRGGVRSVVACHDETRVLDRHELFAGRARGQHVVEQRIATLRDDGEILLDAAPGAGIAVRAGFLFDVPVRFAEDRLEASRATFLAGELASVPLVEVRAPQGSST